MTARLSAVLIGLVAGFGWEWHIAYPDFASPLTAHAGDEAYFAGRLIAGGLVFSTLAALVAFAVITLAARLLRLGKPRA